jgi:hypothetical protein
LITRETVWWETPATRATSAITAPRRLVVKAAYGPREAVKRAVMCEDAARTVHLARSLGPVEPLDPDSVDALYHRYQNVYGQH